MSPNVFFFFFEHALEFTNPLNANNTFDHFVRLALKEFSDDFKGEQKFIDLILLILEVKFDDETLD